MVGVERLGGGGRPSAMEAGSDESEHGARQTAGHTGGDQQAEDGIDNSIHDSTLSTGFRLAVTRLILEAV